MAAAVAHASETDDARPTRLGVGLGYPIVVSVSIPDLFAPDVGLRVDGALYVFAPIVVDLGLELAVSALYDDASGIYAAAGPALALSGTAVLMLRDMRPGTYLGASGVIGYAFGGESMRFFVEAGASAGFRIAGDRDAPPTRVRPRVTVGLAFAF